MSRSLTAPPLPQRLRAPSAHLRYLARAHGFELPSLMLHQFTAADEAYVAQVDADAPKLGDEQLKTVRALFAGSVR